MTAISCRSSYPEKAAGGRPPALHSQKPQHPHVSLRCLLRGRHDHRLEEGALGYSNMKTPRLQNCLLRFSPVFYRRTHLKIGRKSSSSSQRHQ